jgi:hypothetical protein
MDELGWLRLHVITLEGQFTRLHDLLLDIANLEGFLFANNRVVNEGRPSDEKDESVTSVFDPVEDEISYGIFSKEERKVIADKIWLESVNANLEGSNKQLLEYKNKLIEVLAAVENGLAKAEVSLGNTI